MPVEPVAQAGQNLPVTEPTPAVPPAATEPSEPAEPVEPSVPAETRPVKPAEIILEPVYFAFDNFQLSEAGKQQLDKVYQYLSDNPGSKVKLIGHADAKGPAEYNLKLSEKRAVSAKDYLVDKGIVKDRIDILAMGEKNFAAINSNPDGTDNPEGRRLNRRVEYEIISKDNTLIPIHMDPVPENLKYRQ